MICSILSDASCKTVLKEIILGYLGRVDAHIAVNIGQGPCTDPMVASTAFNIDQPSCSDPIVASTAVNIDQGPCTDPIVASTAVNIDQGPCSDRMVSSTPRDTDQNQLAKQRLAEHVERLINVQDNFHSKCLVTFQLFALYLN